MFHCKDRPETQVCCCSSSQWCIAMNHPYFPYMWLLELVEILSQRALPVDSSPHIQVSKYEYWLLIKFVIYTHSKHHSPDSHFLVEWDGIPIMLQWNFMSCCCWLIYDNVCSYISNLTIQCLQKCLIKTLYPFGYNYSSSLQFWSTFHVRLAVKILNIFILCNNW